MKMALLLIWVFHGGMTSQFVPENICEQMAKDAAGLQSGWGETPTAAKCIYEK